jgi:hypothetical protein
MKTMLFVYPIALFWVINVIAIIPPNTGEIKLGIVNKSSGKNFPGVEFVSLKDGIPTGDNSFVQNTGFISLFNGKDLTGWGYRIETQKGVIFESFEGNTESKDKRFFVKERILTANPYKEGDEERYRNLWTVKEFPKDFVLRLEFRASRNADSGIFLRGTQLQCRDYPRVGPYKNLKNYKVLDWNKIEVVVKNNVAHCTCNGELLEEALKIPSAGPIGLESDQGQMEYRNIQLKELE